MCESLSVVIQIPLDPLFTNKMLVINRSACILPMTLLCFYFISFLPDSEESSFSLKFLFWSMMYSGRAFTSSKRIPMY